MKTSKLFKRIFLLFFLLFGAVSFCISIVSGFFLHDQHLREHASQALSIAKVLTSSGRETFLKGDTAAINSFFDKVSGTEDISYLLFQNRSGEIIAHSIVSGFPLRVQELKRFLDSSHTGEDRVAFLSLPSSETIINVRSPILAGEAGNLHIGMSRANVSGSIGSVVLKIQGAALVLFLAGIGVMTLLVKRITRPLGELTSYAGKIAAHDFSVTVDIRRDDEIGALATNMTHMAEELEKFICSLEGSVRKASGELEDTLNHLRIVLENIADGFAVFDTRGNVLQYNDQLANMLSLRQRDLTGMNIQDLLGTSVSRMLEPEDSATTHIQLPTSSDHTDLRKFEIIVPRADGTSFPGEISFSTVKTKTGPHFIAIIRDITPQKMAEKKFQKVHLELEQEVEGRTKELSEANRQLILEIRERKRAEDALAAEKELLATTLRSIGEGVITTDIQGKIVLLNRIAERMIEVTQNMAKGKNLREVYRVFLPAPEGGRIEADLLEKHVVLEKNSGERIHVAQAVSPIMDRQNTIIGAVLVFRDITRDKKLEEEHIKSEKLSSLGILAGGIAHDFNNILTAILNSLSLSRLKTDGYGVLKHIRRAETAAIRAQKLANQLLTFSKGGSPIKEVTCIRNLIEEAVAFALRGSNIKCELRIEEGIWTVEVDHGQIIQVLDNLIINAMQAMPEGGGITVSVENVHLKQGTELPLPPGSYVRLSIQDQGNGIPPEYMDQIFDPYFTTKKKGSGLGLATTYSIVKNHQGHIEFSSKTGKGTVFRIYLPGLPEKEIVPMKKPGTEIAFGNGRILVMDDEQSLRETLADTLDHLGYEAFFAADGRETLRIYKSLLDEGKPVDAVVMDLTIPGGMGGRETIAELLKIAPDAKVIVSSGYSQDPVMSDFRKYGFADVLLKPFTIEEFSAKLRNLLS